MKESKEVLLQKISFMSDDFKIAISDRMSSASENAFHPEIEIKLFYEGDSIQTIGSETIIATAGDITIANPYEVHANIETDLHSGKYYIVMIDLDFFENTGLIDTDLRSLLITNGAAFNNHIKNNKRLNDIIMQVITEAKDQKEYYQSVIRNLMAQFFCLLIRDHLYQGTPRPLTTKEIKKTALIEPAITKIFNDYNQNITVEQLAELCHLSKFYFCRIFKEVTGDTPISYITRHRIHIAKAMLKDKTKSIQQVATLCGYNDISYFYRCYKKVAGQSPRR